VAASEQYIFHSDFMSPSDAESGLGKRPVVFDILGPDWATSLLPEDVRLVLHTNPKSMSPKYQAQIIRIQTRGGFVEQHWGDQTIQIDFNMATGGFMRLYSGMSNVTSPDYGGTRRDTIAYDKYLDMLALFHNNGSIYDSRGKVVLQGIIKITFDEGVYLGWFTSFSVTESAEKPYQFEMTASFEVHKEVMSWRSTYSTSDVSSTTSYGDSGVEQGQVAVFQAEEG
jgi:hypothetical protein